MQFVLVPYSVYKLGMHQRSLVELFCNYYKRPA